MWFYPLSHPEEEYSNYPIGQNIQFACDFGLHPNTPLVYFNADLELNRGSPV